MRCEYCDQPVPRVILRGDLVQHDDGQTGLVLNIVAAGAWLSVGVLGARDQGEVTRLWPSANVDFIHGTIHVTERL